MPPRAGGVGEGVEGRSVEEGEEGRGLRGNGGGGYGGGRGRVIGKEGGRPERRVVL